MLAHIHAAGLPSDLSVKLTQLGLDLDREFSLREFFRASQQLAEAALSAVQLTGACKHDMD